MVFVENEQNDVVIQEEILTIIKTAASKTLEVDNFSVDTEVSVVITGSETIRNLNKESRGKDSVTDVLSFPVLDYDEEGYIIENPFDMDFNSGNVLLGDIVICAERAKQQAEEYGHSFEREMVFLTVHGMLHLLGYDHETGKEAEEKMFGMQDKILREMGMER